MTTTPSESGWTFMIHERLLTEPDLQLNGKPHLIAIFALCEAYGRVQNPKKLEQGITTWRLFRGAYAKRFQVSPQTVSRAVRFLEDGGFVRRSYRGRNGGSALLIDLTKKSRALFGSFGAERSAETTTPEVSPMTTLPEPNGHQRLPRTVTHDYPERSPMTSRHVTGDTLREQHVQKTEKKTDKQTTAAPHPSFPADASGSADPVLATDVASPAQSEPSARMAGKEEMNPPPAAGVCCSEPSAPVGATPPDPQDDEKEEQIKRSAKTFRRFYREAMVSVDPDQKEQHKFSADESEAVENYFREGGSVLGTCVLLIEAWDLIGASNENKDGSIYRYGACQQSKDIEKFFKNIDQIQKDVESVSDQADFSATGMLLRIRVWFKQFEEDRFVDDLCEKLFPVTWEKYQNQYRKKKTEEVPA